MEEQTKILNAFVASVIAKRKRNIKFLYLLIFASLTVGVYLLIWSVMAVRKDLNQYRAVAPDTPPYRVGEFNPADVTWMVEPATLANKFNSDDRLLTSNQLIQLYGQDKAHVIKALIDAIQPEEEITSYRVNLYIAFTLARIDPVWEGSQPQLDKVKQLTKSKNYKDPTFKKWVDVAIVKYHERGT